VDKLTHEEVHDGDKEFVGRKSSPIMRWDSRHTTVELSTVGISTLGMKDSNSPPSQSMV
jgi:hypothetical protein